MIRNVLSPRLSHPLSLAAAACCAFMLWNTSVARADDAGQSISSEARIDYCELAKNLEAGRTTPDKVIALYGTKCIFGEQWCFWYLDDFGIHDRQSGSLLELEFDKQGKFLRADLRYCERQTGFHLGQQASP